MFVIGLCLLAVQHISKNKFAKCLKNLRTHDFFKTSSEFYKMVLLMKALCLYLKCKPQCMHFKFKEKIKMANSLLDVNFCWELDILYGCQYSHTLYFVSFIFFFFGKEKVNPLIHSVQTRGQLQIRLLATVKKVKKQQPSQLQASKTAMSTMFLQFVQCLNH